METNQTNQTNQSKKYITMRKGTLIFTIVMTAFVFIAVSAFVMTYFSPVLFNKKQAEGATISDDDMQKYERLKFFNSFIIQLLSVHKML